MQLQPSVGTRMRCSCLHDIFVSSKQILFAINIPYFFHYKTDFFSLQNNPKKDLSYKTDLDLWTGLGRVKLIL